ncbi:unnamed protein product [Amoebophrya sp. A25]|nr:unnamed protein product [Amoebophrya sp. A25]|eukprot:GSA25T00010266001.1
MEKWGTCKANKLGQETVYEQPNYQQIMSPSLLQQIYVTASKCEQLMMPASNEDLLHFGGLQSAVCGALRGFRAALEENQHQAGDDERAWRQLGEDYWSAVLDLLSFLQSLLTLFRTKTNGKDDEDVAPIPDLLEREIIRAEEKIKVVAELLLGGRDHERGDEDDENHLWEDSHSEQYLVLRSLISSGDVISFVQKYDLFSTTKMRCSGWELQRALELRYPNSKDDLNNSLVINIAAQVQLLLDRYGVGEEICLADFVLIFDTDSETLWEAVAARSACLEPGRDELSQYVRFHAQLVSRGLVVQYDDSVGGTETTPRRPLIFFLRRFGRWMELLCRDEAATACKQLFLLDQGCFSGFRELLVTSKVFAPLGVSLHLLTPEFFQENDCDIMWAPDPVSFSPSGNYLSLQQQLALQSRAQSKTTGAQSLSPSGAASRAQTPPCTAVRLDDASFSVPEVQEHLRVARALLDAENALLDRTQRAIQTSVDVYEASRIGRDEDQSSEERINRGRTLQQKGNLLSCCSEGALVLSGMLADLGDAEMNEDGEAYNRDSIHAQRNALADWTLRASPFLVIDERGAKAHLYRDPKDLARLSWSCDATDANQKSSALHVCEDGGCFAADLDHFLSSAKPSIAADDSLRQPAEQAGGSVGGGSRIPHDVTSTSADAAKEDASSTSTSEQPPLFLGCPRHETVARRLRLALAARHDALTARQQFDGLKNTRLSELERQRAIYGAKMERERVVLTKEVNRQITGLETQVRNLEALREGVRHKVGEIFEAKRELLLQWGCSGTTPVPGSSALLTSSGSSSRAAGPSTVALNAGGSAHVVGHVAMKSAGASGNLNIAHTTTAGGRQSNNTSANATHNQHHLYNQLYPQAELPHLPGVLDILPAPPNVDVLAEMDQEMEILQARKALLLERAEKRRKEGEKKLREKERLDRVGAVTEERFVRRMVGAQGE